MQNNSGIQEKPKCEESLMSFQGVRKRVGDRFILNRIDLAVPSGRILGLIGENGVGKSTLLRLMAGILLPDDGEIAGTRRIAYAPDRDIFYNWMKVQDALAFYQGYYRGFRTKKARELLETAGISPGMRIRTLSKGQRERLALTLTLSIEAELYLLDEPFGGADPAFKREARIFLLKNLPDGASAVIATHLLKDLEQLFDEVIFLTGGSELRRMETEELRETRGMSVEQDYLEEIRSEKQEEKLSE